MKAISKALIKVQQTVKNLEKNSRVGKGFNAYDGTKMFDVMQAFNSAGALQISCRTLGRKRSDASICFLLRQNKIFASAHIRRKS